MFSRKVPAAETARKATLKLCDRKSPKRKSPKPKSPKRESPRTTPRYCP